MALACRGRASSWRRAALGPLWRFRPLLVLHRASFTQPAEAAASATERIATAPTPEATAAAKTARRGGATTRRGDGIGPANASQRATRTKQAHDGAGSFREKLPARRRLFGVSPCLRDPDAFFFRETRGALFGAFFWCFRPAHVRKFPTLAKIMAAKSAREQGGSTHAMWTLIIPLVLGGTAQTMEWRGQYETREECHSARSALLAVVEKARSAPFEGRYEWPIAEQVENVDAVDQPPGVAAGWHYARREIGYCVNEASEPSARGRN